MSYELCLVDSRRFTGNVSPYIRHPQFTAHSSKLTAQKLSTTGATITQKRPREHPTGSDQAAKRGQDGKNGQQQVGR